MTVDRKELDDSLARFLEGELEPEDSVLILAVLEDDPTFRDELQKLLSFDNLLWQQNTDADTFVDAVSICLGKTGPDEPFVQGVSKRITGSGEVLPSEKKKVDRVAWAVALCAVVIAAVPWLMPLSALRPAQQDGHSADIGERSAASDSGDASITDLPTSNQTDHASSGEVSFAPPLVALLVDAVDPQFIADRAPTGVQFFKGRYVLESGVIHLRLTSGTDLVAQAPVDFEIHDHMNVMLHSGRVRAIVSDSAHGFSIHAPGVAYEDLGTEFGVVVTPESSELHVFDGAVEIKREDGSLFARKKIGESVNYADGELTPIRPSKFPTPDSIGLLRWSNWHEAVRDDPDLIAFFGFQPPKTADSTLHSSATVNAPVSGRINRAHWVTGRWPGKKALLFDHRWDYVAVDVLGEYSHFSLTAWVKLDGLDYAGNALFNSDGWSDRDIHWQLNRSGGQWFDLHATEGKVNRRPLLRQTPWTSGFI